MSDDLTLRIILFSNDSAAFSHPYSIYIKQQRKPALGQFKSTSRLIQHLRLSVSNTNLTSHSYIH